MGSSEERALAHGRLLRERGIDVQGEGPPASILESWARCASAGLDLWTPPPICVVEAAELRRRREALAQVRPLAQAELQTLFEQIAGSNFLLAFADRDGVILDLYADNRFALSASSEDIVTGSCWSEALCGTNGLGTALATRQSVAVNGPEHFFAKYSAISCTAAPIRDAFGELVGVLDASSYYESRQRHTQALVQMSASTIENALLVQQMRDATVLAIHPRAEFLRTISAGVLAFGEDGMLRAFNPRARSLLAGLDLRAGTPFEALFDEPFEHLVARSQRHAELRLRDTLGSSLVARCVHRPLPPARPAPARPAEEGYIAEDPRVRDALRTVEAAVRLNAPILIEGETGTGKEMLARHAHRASGRRGAFVPVNCGALPAELVEAEMFGYVGGAYTGARREGARGLIASADGGTLLLDEVGELPPALQAALLRFLDDRWVRPVGGDRARRVDVQVLSATHVDLERAVAEQRFRADLLYRLDTVRVSLPPLREREDFAAVVREVLRAIDPSAIIDEAGLARLAEHRWPGNVRELRSVLTRALLGGEGRVSAVRLDGLLPPSGRGGRSSRLAGAATEAVLREFERSGRCVSRTARNLGVSRTTVYRHLREAGRDASSSPQARPLRVA